MKPITQKQIAELPDKEQRMLGVWTSKLLASLYKKRISLAQREIEAGIKGEPK